MQWCACLQLRSKSLSDLLQSAASIENENDSMDSNTTSDTTKSVVLVRLLITLVLCWMADEQKAKLNNENEFRMLADHC